MKSGSISELTLSDAVSGGLYAAMLLHSISCPQRPSRSPRWLELVENLRLRASREHLVERTLAIARPHIYRA